MGKKSKKSTRVVKKLLDSFLTCHTLIEEVRETNTVLTCPVRNYSTLKVGTKYLIDGVLYDGEWSFILQKSKHKLRIILTMENVYENTSVSLRSNDGQIVRDIHSEATDEGRILFDFENRAILDPQMKLLNDDILVVQCVYTARPHETNIVIMSGLQEKPRELMQNSDVDFLCNDLRDLYLSSRFYDLVITVNESKFKVHKFIMCARSAYFERLRHSYPDFVHENIILDVNHVIMHEVLLYVYSGQLKDMDLDDMISVFEVACTLEIESLIEKCIHFFRTNFSFDNLPVITYLAKEYHVEKLGKEVKEFLEKLPESILQTNEWKDSVEKVTLLLYHMGML